MDLSVFKNELAVLEARKAAIENLIAVYGNGTVTPKATKRTIKKRLGKPTFQEQLVALAAKLCGKNSGTIKVKEVLDAAIESNLVSGKNRMTGKNRDKALQKVAATLSVAAKRNQFRKIGKGHYELAAQ